MIMSGYRTMSPTRRRSRSPTRSSAIEDTNRQRKRSPHKSSRRHGGERPGESRKVSRNLPFQSRQLHKSDYASYRALFAEYLSLQKQLDIHTIDDQETRGRWKSFLGKWNRGELAEGWYEPSTKAKLDERWADESAPRSTVAQMSKGNARTELSSGRPNLSPRRDESNLQEDSDDSDEDDDYGPSLPTTQSSGKMRGPSMPISGDLQARREVLEEDREARLTQVREQRKVERKVQKERLDELAPRAEPGTRERQLEKKRDVAAANRSFREARSPGVEEVNENELMGEDGIASYKAEKRAQDRRKTEREIRKEESLRARIAEREERMAEHRKKEDKTMEMLKALAKQRFR